MNGSVGLKAVRGKNETWRECVNRNASMYGLQVECLNLFDGFISEGMDEARAAWNSMYEWDLGLEVSTEGEVNAPEASR